MWDTKKDGVIPSSGNSVQLVFANRLTMLDPVPGIRPRVDLLGARVGGNCSIDRGIAVAMDGNLEAGAMKFFNQRLELRRRQKRDSRNRRDRP